MYTTDSRAATKKVQEESIIDMPRNKRKQNHIKCSVKTTKGRKGKHKNGNTEQGQEIETVMNEVDDDPIISIIILNVNGLNASIKRDCEWIKKYDLFICCTQEIHFKYKTYSLRVNRGRKIYHLSLIKRK